MTPETSQQLAYETTGSGDRIVLIHGFTQSRRTWASIAATLAGRHAVCAVDLPGHGASSAVRPPDLESAARLVGTVGGPATYLGYSLGGRVALTLALDRPDLVEQLVLVGATPGIADDAERSARRASDDRLADRLDPSSGGALGLDAFLDEWLSQPLFAHLTQEQADRPSRLVNTTAGLAHSLRTNGTGTQNPSFDRLGSLAMPVLLVAGADDGKFTAIAREMAARIGSNASVAIVERAGHSVPFEQPSAFLAAVEAWLGGRG